MSKQRWILGTIGVIGILALAVVLDPTYTLKGLLNNESFFRGRSTSYWRKAFKTKNPNPNSAFGLELGATPDPAGVPVLIELMNDKDDQLRFWACHALAIIGPEARPAIPTLLAMLTNPDVYYRRNATFSLAKIVSPDDAKKVLPGLIATLKDEDDLVVYHSAVAVGQIGPQAKEAVPLLLELIKSARARKPVTESEKETIRNAATWALKQIDPEAATKAGVP